MDGITAFTAPSPPPSPARGEGAGSTAAAPASRAEIETGIVRGEFPKRALRAVLDWLDQHQPELMENWQAAQQRRPLKAIAPLE